MGVKISAVICTYNRANFLPKVIESLSNQTLDKKFYEIIVVDNCSTDNTKSIVFDLSREYPSVKYVHEPHQGLSFSRNTGWEKSKGDYVAYIDDDAIACENWLEGIIESFEQNNPKPGAVGGKVIPIWGGPKPDWLKGKFFLNQLTVLDLGESHYITDTQNEWLVGANISFERALLSELGGFNTNLGRKGKSLLSNEETEIRERCYDLGRKFYYSDKIPVKHYIPSSRLTRKWFIRRRFWQGVTDCFINEGTASFKKVFNSFYRVLRFWFKVFFHKQNFPSFRHKLHGFYLVGYLYGMGLMLKKR